MLGSIIRYSTVVLILVTMGALFSCNKDNSLNSTGKTIWMRVLSDTIGESTNDELFLGKNGKVITSDQGEIILYYFNELLQKTFIIKCDSEGNKLWEKVIEKITPSDMILLNDGSIVLSGSFDDAANAYSKVHFYAIRPTGTIDSLLVNTPQFSSWGNMNSAMYALPDNSIIVSGTTRIFAFTSLPYSYMGFVMKLNSSFQLSWRRSLKDVSYSEERVAQNSIIPTINNQYLFQFSQVTDRNYADSNYFGLITGLVNANSVIDTIAHYQSGNFIVSSGSSSGVQNNYCNGLMHDGFDPSNFIYHYSNPVSFDNQFQNIPNGFIRIGSDGVIKDTIPIPLPSGYRIVSCTQNNGRFLLAAYRSDLGVGTNDFSAGHTLFLTGGTDWRTTSTFTFQDFYTDFFPSVAAAPGGGFIIMGKIQSFNKQANKLVLIKWSPDN